MNDGFLETVSQIMYSRTFALVSNIFLAIVFVWFCYVHVHAYIYYGGILYLLYASMEGLVVVFSIIRSVPRERSRSAIAVLAAFGGTFLSLMFQPGGAAPVPTVALSLGVVGVVMAILCYLSLNTSFGITPSIRKVKTTGMYAVVRHPMYASYVPLQLGYILDNISLINLVLVSCIWIAVLTRIHYEERLLLQDNTYRRYVKHVPYRLLPGVY